MSTMALKKLKIILTRASHQIEKSAKCFEELGAPLGGNAFEANPGPASIWGFVHLRWRLSACFWKLFDKVAEEKKVRGYPSSSCNGEQLHPRL